jgi:6-pyruvoyltetrahydropterin/6-carboxytetrahydropterin synthase
MLVSKKFSFDAAHYLPNYEGKCKNMHGHHWVVEVACSGKVNEKSGMVVDFAELKDFFGWVERIFDHKLLNDFIKNPTAENICEYIYGEFNLWCIARQLRFEYIRIWETENSMAELNGKDKSVINT